MSTQTNEENSSIGAIWEKVSQKGNKFYTGNVKINGVEVAIVLFPNDRKPAGSKQPDWRIYESKPVAGSAPKTSAPAQTSAPVRTQQRPTGRPTGRPAPTAAPAPAPEPSAETEAAGRTL